MRLPLAALALGLLATAVAIPPAAAIDHCYDGVCGVVPASCQRASKAGPLHVHCDEVIDAIKEALGGP